MEKYKDFLKYEESLFGGPHKVYKKKKKGENSMKAEIRNCLIWYVNRVSETVQYANWSDDFCRKEIRDANDIFAKSLKKYIDFKNLTKKQARELGFQKWREEEPDFYLIPLYLLPVLPIGTEVTCINGEKIVYNGHNIDNDIRCGCIAYGIKVKQ